MQLTSPAFAPGGPVPSRYTCDGEDVSPPLAWDGVPEGAESLALIVDDPDAPGKIWVHWVLYALPPEMTGLEEGAVPAGAREGMTDFGRTGYGGPCPPSGTHRYDFTLYALDARLDLPPGATKSQLLEAMEGHVLAKSGLQGRYART